MNTHLFSAAVCMLAFAACSAAPDSPDSSVVGNWENPERDLALQLAHDGTFTASAPGGNTSGRYRMAENGKLQMDFDSISTSVDVSLGDGKLTFCPEGHGCERLRRAR